MNQRQVQILVALGAVVVVLLVVMVTVLVIGWDDQPPAPTSPAGITSSSGLTSTTLPRSTSTSAGSSTTSSTTSTTTSTTSTSTTTTTTALPPGACPSEGVGPLAVGATVLVELAGDFDGDGAEDRFLVFEDALGTRWTRVELAYGYADLSTAPAADLNVKTVNLGGAADLVAMDHLFSSPARMASFYQFIDCSLVHVYTSEGRPAQFVLRRSDTELAGVTCTADGITVTEATTTDGALWEVGSVTYLWDPAGGQLWPSMAAAAVLHSPEDDAAIQSYGDWNC